MSYVSFAKAFIAIVPVATLLACGSVHRQAATEEYVDTIATVHAVDSKERLIAIDTPGGEMAVVQLGSQVKNLSEVRPGDRLKIRHSRAMAAHVVKASQPAVISTTESTESQFDPGTKPATTIERKTTALFHVDAIDTAANAMLVTGPNGSQQLVHVRDAEMQEYIRTLQAGDTVEVTFTEATAISIEPAT